MNLRSFPQLLGFCFLLSTTVAFTLQPGRIFRNGRTKLSRNGFSKLQMSANELGGNLLCTGITDDNMTPENFMLELLHFQKKWDLITAALSNVDTEKKLYMTRTARYSGLMDVLKFEGTDDSTLKSQVEAADAWIAMNVPKEKLAGYATIAKEAGLKRLVMVSKFSREDGLSSEVESATKLLQESDVDYTLIRVDGIVHGDEGGEYMVLNMTQVSVEGEDFKKPIKRGNLARVVSEALTLESAKNKEVAVLGPDEIGTSYIQVQRGDGTERSEEVASFFDGYFGYIYQDLSKLKERNEAERKVKEEKKEEVQFVEEESDLKRLAEYFLEGWQQKKDERESRIETICYAVAMDPHRRLYQENITDMGDDEFAEIFKELPKVQEAAKEIVDFIDEAYFLFNMRVVFGFSNVEEFESKFGKLPWYLPNTAELMEQEWTEKELGSWAKEQDLPAHVHFQQIVSKDEIYAMCKEAIDADPEMAKSDDPSNYFAYRQFLGED
mmetsp:Transcript_36403/g.48036  ORF Transcript_36403/g.48036 Transcript_36403/m.48036 type:complete len:496 (-) Transcript_36403:388-1875(-)